MTTRIIVTADMVRTWAEGRKLAVADSGRLPASVVEAYNKVHKAQYEPRRIQPKKVTLPVGRANKKLVKAEFPLSEVRAWAAKNGHNLGQRGRIPQPVMEAFAEAQFAA